MGQFHLTTGRNFKSNKSGELSGSPWRKPQTGTVSPREDIEKHAVEQRHTKENKKSFKMASARFNDTWNKG